MLLGDGTTRGRTMRRHLKFLEYVTGTTKSRPLFLHPLSLIFLIQILIFPATYSSETILLKIKHSLRGKKVGKLFRRREEYPWHLSHLPLSCLATGY